MGKRFKLYLVLLLSLYALFVFLLAPEPIFSDFAKFHASAQLYFEGASIYREIPVDRWLDWPADQGPKPGPVHPNLNPPFVTLLLFPLAPFDFSTAFWIWTALSLAAGMTAMAWIESETRTGQAQLSRQLGFQLLLLAYYPTFATIEYGQLTLFLLPLLASAWIAARNGGGWRAGLWLGLALSVKPFFALFGLFFLVRKRWRELISMAAVSGLSIAVSAAVFGWDTLLEYRNLVGQITWAGTNWNASFLGLATRLFGGSESAALWQLPEVGRWLASLASVFAAGLLAALAWPGRASPAGASFDLGFCLTLALMLLISPLGWLYYFPLLLLPFVVAWQNHPGRTRWILLASFALSAIPIPLRSILHQQPPWHWHLWSMIPSLSLLLLTLVLGVLTWRTGRQKPASP